MEKIYRYLGLARRGGNLISGYNTCLASMKGKKIKLLIIASDASDNTKNKFIELAEKNNITYRIWGEKNTLAQAIGEMDRSILGITDEKFSEVMICELDKS